MANIPSDYASGGAGLSSPAGGSARHPALATVARDIATDFETLRVAHEALRAQFVALLAKLDADGGVTDTNYAALLTPAAAGIVTTDEILTKSV